MNKDWYYAVGAERKGPVTDSEFAQLCQSGTIQPSTLVWNSDMTDWQSLADWKRSMAPVMGPSPNLTSIKTTDTIPIPPGKVLCFECRLPFAPDEVVSISGQQVCVRCKPAFLQKLKEGVATPTEDGIFRAGKDVVAGRDAKFPDLCVHCGKPGDGRRIERKLYWHSGWIYALILLSIWIYIIVAMLTRKKSKVQFSVCAEHRSAHWKWVWVTWGTVVAMIAFLGAVVVSGQPWGFVGFVGCLICLIFFALKCRYVYAARMGEEEVRIRGARPGFLETLPEWSGE